MADVLAETGAKALLVGGVAVGQYGASRLTFDVDVAIAERDEASISAALQQRGFTRTYRAENFARFQPPAAGFIVDFLFLDAATFAAMWQGGVEATLADRSFRVAAPEHLICMKLHALRFGRAERLDRDVSDILHLMKKCGWTPETREFLDACSKYGTAPWGALIRERWAP